MAELGKAYIEVRADLAKFPAELRTKLKVALKEALVGVEFKELGDKAEKAGENAAERAGKGFARKGKTAFEKAGKEAGKGLLTKLIGFFDGRRSNDKSSLFGSISGAISGGIADGLKSGQSAASSLSSIGGAFSKIGDVGGEVGSILKIAGLVVLIPVVIQLAGALIQLGAALFALPAAIGVVIAIAAPLMIAMQGIGEAVSAGLSGDTEKFNEALKGLAPSARTVVKELVKLGPQFKSIKANVQGAFFAPLIGAFTTMGKTLLPVVNSGLTLVAKSLGNVVRGLIDVFTSAQNLSTFRALFQSTSRIVQTMEPALANLAQAFLNLIKPALPFLERGATAFRDFAGRVEAFTAKIAADGRLSGWLEKAAGILGDLVRLGKNLAENLITLLGGEVGDNGADFLDSLADGIKKINDYLKTEEGQKAIHNLAVSLKFFGDIVLFFIGIEPAMLSGFNAIFDAVRLLLRGLELLGGGFVWLVKKIGEFISKAGSAIADFFTKTVPGWFDKLIGWFAELPGRIGDAISGLQHTLRDWFVGLLEDWYQGVLFKVGQVIGLFLSLPQLIPAALSALGDTLGKAWDDAWAFAVEAIHRGIQSTLDVIYGIPGFLADAGAAIGTFFHDLWTNVILDVQATVTNGFNSLMNFLGSLPGRVMALGPRLLDAARSLGHKIAEGLSEIGNFATDLGKKVLNALKSGINWVISSINRGIADIDEKLPGTLPRIPMLARGAVVDRPTLALVGEAGREVVLPMNDPARARELADQSGLFNLLMAGKPSSAPVINVYLDPSGVLIPITRTVVDDALDQQGNELAYARAA